MKVEGATIMSIGELCARPEAVLESKAIVIDESTTIEPRNHSVEPVRRMARKASMLAAMATALATSGRVAADSAVDFTETLREKFGRQREVARRRNAERVTRYISRTGEPHGRSGDKLIRKAMRKQVGRAVLR